MDRSSKTWALIQGLLTAAWLAACADEGTQGEETATAGSATATAGSTTVTEGSVDFGEANSDIRQANSVEPIARVEDAGPELSDANILALLDHANQADSTAGSVAASKGTHRLVRQYARRMMADHHRLRAQGVALTRKLDVMRQPPAEDPITALAHLQMGALASAQKGRAFDRTYLEQEVEIHEALLDLTEQCLRSVGNAELRVTIEEARSLIRVHLAQAQEILGVLDDTA
jgi:putative membrane protein